MKFLVKDLRGFNDLLMLKEHVNRCEYMHVNDLIKKQVLELAEQDRSRGVPFLQPTRVISTDYKIKYNENIELFGDEIAYKAGLLDDVVIDFGDSEENKPDTGKVKSDEKDVDRATPVHSSKTNVTPRETTQEESGTSRHVTNKENRKIGVQQKVPPEVEPKNESSDELWNSILSATKENKKPNSGLNTSNTSNIEIFIKNNNGCTVRETLEYFTAKEINKMVRLGRIFKKNGRLSI